jgi:Fur family ferric uptake transcriptional regulator
LLQFAILDAVSVNQEATFRSLLSRHNYHVTKARLVVFRILQSPEPLSIREIIDKSKEQIDRVSVYRAIDLFEKLGVIHKIYIGWKDKIELSDTFLDHHHHLSCTNCGKIVKIQDEKHIDSFIDSIVKEHGFVAVQHRFEVDGVCPTCQKNK